SGGTVQINVGGPPTDRVLASFHSNLSPGAGNYALVRTAATRAASLHAPMIEGTLSSAGLLRSSFVGFVSATAMLGFGALAVLIGVVRIDRGISLNRPVAFLVVELLILALVILFATRARMKGRSRRAERYLKWLEGATTSLRMDVSSARRTSAEDV